jgi:hypothetical protein
MTQMLESDKKYSVKSVTYQLYYITYVERSTIDLSNNFFGRAPVSTGTRPKYPRPVIPTGSLKKRRCFWKGTGLCSCEACAPKVRSHA